MAYEWAANKQKLSRSMAFVNASLGEQKITDEVREKMIKEYYLQIAGLLNREEIPHIEIEEQFKCDECDFIAHKEMGLKIHKGKDHKNETTATDN